jgi:hypothetical protein
MIEDLRHWEKLVSMCDQAALGSDYLELAAHVYAHMVNIVSTGGVPVEPAKAPPSLDLDVICPAVLGLHQLTDRGEIYWSLKLVLDAIDMSYSEVDSCDWYKVVKLQTLEGEVHIGGKRASPLAKLRSTLLSQMQDGASFPNMVEPEPNLNLANMRLLWTDSKCELSRESSGSLPFRLLQPATENDEALRIALCPLEGAFHPRFELVSGGFYALRAEPMNDLDGLIRRLSEVLEAAEEQRVHLVVFPELMVCEDALAHLRTLLLTSRSSYPYGVIAGSFHVWKDQSRSPVNESCLLEKVGTLLAHQKRGQFKFPKKRIRNRFFPRNSLVGQPHHIVESIEYGQKLRFVDTVFGTLAIMICADFIDLDFRRNFLNAAKALRPDLLIVVSMSDETRNFEEGIRNLSHYGIATFMVNASCICKPSPQDKTKSSDGPKPDKARATDTPSLALAHLGLFEHLGAPHVYFRWRADDSSLEFWTYKGASKEWKKLDEPNDHGVFFLRVGGADAGVILDFKPQIDHAYHL